MVYAQKSDTIDAKEWKSQVQNIFSLKQYTKSKRDTGHIIISITSRLILIATFMSWLIMNSTLQKLLIPMNPHVIWYPFRK